MTCPICRDPDEECWGLYKGLDAGATTYVDGDPVSCPAWERELAERIAQIVTVDDLRACIVWYCDPYPTGGILHLTLEEGSYTDEIIRWQLRDETGTWAADSLGRALGEALLKFSPAEREWANRWEAR